MGNVGELIVGIILLILGVMLGPGISNSVRAIVGLVLLIVGLVLTLLAAFSFA